MSKLTLKTMMMQTLALKERKARRVKPRIQQLLRRSACNKLRNKKIRRRTLNFSASRKKSSELKKKRSKQQKRRQRKSPD